MTAYLAFTAAAIIGPLCALREWRWARRETLVERIRKYTV